MLSNSWLLYYSIIGKSRSPYIVVVSLNQDALVYHSQGVVIWLKSKQSHFLSRDFDTWVKWHNMGKADGVDSFLGNILTTQSSNSGSVAFGLRHFPGQLFSLPLDFVRISWSPSNNLFFFFHYRVRSCLLAIKEPYIIYNYTESDHFFLQIPVVLSVHTTQFSISVL